MNMRWMCDMGGWQHSFRRNLVLLKPICKDLKKKEAHYGLFLLLQSNFHLRRHLVCACFFFLSPHVPLPTSVPYKKWFTSVYNHVLTSSLAGRSPIHEGFSSPVTYFPSLLCLSPRARLSALLCSLSASPTSVLVRRHVYIQMCSLVVIACWGFHDRSAGVFLTWVWSCQGRGQTKGLWVRMHVCVIWQEEAELCFHASSLCQHCSQGWERGTEAEPVSLQHEIAGMLRSCFPTLD